MDERERRIVRKPIGSYSLEVAPNVENLLTDALSVIATEITKYKIKSGKGISLELKEARILQGYIKSLVELSKESREREKEVDPSDLSNEELLELAGKFIGQVKQAKDDKTITKAKIVQDEPDDDSND